MLNQSSHLGRSRFRAFELLRPEPDWEGSGLPLAASRVGAAEGREHALRDPCPFVDYLFHSGAGENAIGLARLGDAP